MLSCIIVGLTAGFIGSKIVDRRGQGFWLVGIIGALFGNFLFLIASGVTSLNFWSMIAAAVGSVAMLLIYNAIAPRGREAREITPTVRTNRTVAGAVAPRDRDVGGLTPTLVRDRSIGAPWDGARAPTDLG